MMHFILCTCLRLGGNGAWWALGSGDWVWRKYCVPGER